MDTSQDKVVESLIQEVRNEIQNNNIQLKTILSPSMVDDIVTIAMVVALKICERQTK